MNVLIGLLGTVFAAMWVLLYLRGVGSRKYAAYIEQLTNDMFVLKDIYFIGFALLDTLHLRCDTGFMAKRMDKVQELFGEKYAPFYNYAIWAGKVTLCLTIIPIMLFLGLIAETPVLSVVGLVFGPVMAVSLNNSLDNRVEARREKILMDFPQVISKLSMLLKAGMTLQDAWEQIAFSREGELYQEMRTVNMEIKNAGVGMEEAYMRFARRCALPEVRKFASLVIQNMKKGSADLVYALQEMADERWQQKKHLVLRKGELAGSQLLMPIMLMFIGVMLLIMVPAFVSMTSGL